MMGNSPKLGLVNVDVHTKYGQSLFIHSQDMEKKPNVDKFTEPRNDGKTSPFFQSGAIITEPHNHRRTG